MAPNRWRVMVCPWRGCVSVGGAVAPGEGVRRWWCAQVLTVRLTVTVLALVIRHGRKTLRARDMSQLAKKSVALHLFLQVETMHDIRIGLMQRSNAPLVFVTSVIRELRHRHATKRKLAEVHVEDTHHRGFVATSSTIMVMTPSLVTRLAYPACNATLFG